jgi:endonuclease YncB( thermonuclease family)
MHNGQSERIRLNGVDCPEKGQVFGKKAKQFTFEMVFGKDVTVQSYRLDRYGRTIWDVLLTDGMNLNRELVRQGLRGAMWNTETTKHWSNWRPTQEMRSGLVGGYWTNAEYRHPTRQSSSEATVSEPLLSYPAPINLPTIQPLSS